MHINDSVEDLLFCGLEREMGGLLKSTSVLGFGDSVLLAEAG